MKFYSILLFLFIALTGYSQEIIKAPTNPSNVKKGEFFLYWGYNWSWYSKSDIHFKGEGYDFELKEVKAADKQTPFTFENYFQPTYITTPQYNLRLGYYFSNHYSVSLGIDHMKYVVIQGQTVNMNGTISGTGSEYDGVYNNESVVIQEGFLEFEHTDGLNYVNAEVRRFDEVYSFNKDIQLNLFAGAGLGPLIPKTNTTLINKERYDQFHVAGFGVHGLVGVNFTFFKYFFVQTEFKGGYINMPDIRTTSSTSDSASQSFFFGQYNFNVGASFNFLEHKKGKKKKG